MNNTPDTNRMELYRRQMMEMYQKAAPSPSSVTGEDNWLDNRYPEPDIQRDKETMASLPPSNAPTPIPSSTDFVGYLRVYAFTGGGAEPIEGARVVVTRLDGNEQTIYANLTTDGDGFTSVIALPSVDPTLTLRPGTVQPYVTYAVRVTADGFQPVVHNNIPVYGNNYVTQPVAMIPILPGKDAANTQEFASGGPANL